MFSVNIDKLVKMTDQEKNSFQTAVQSINDAGPNQMKTLSIIGGGIDSFKLAYAFSETGKKVLFVDADLDKNVFLGRYKLGKNLKGFSDFLSEDDVISSEDMICMTNHDDVNIVFTGDAKESDYNRITEQNMRAFVKTFDDAYDLIILQSDDRGMVAKYCDAAVVLTDLDQYSELSADIKVNELNNNGCYVLGVIINE